MKRKELTVLLWCFVLLLFASVAWAAPVPDTGQTDCYDYNGVEIPCPSPGQPFYGQDACYSINPMSYTKLDGNGNALPDSASSWTTVRDNVTGLTWEMKKNKDGQKDYTNPHDADNTYNWFDSNQDFINALNDAKYGGFNDWRLPTIKELAYIVKYSIPYPGPTIDSEYFPNTAASWYWSSTTHFYGGHAWTVYFDYGYDDGCYKSNSGYVRAVRDGQSGLLGNSIIGSLDLLNSLSMDEVEAAAGGYTDNGDGTVTDTSTGLMWEQAGSSDMIDWENALSYCEGSNLGGYTDWRLPTIKELRSLVDYSANHYPSINTTYFPNAVASWYWSSTTYANITYRAWLVSFSGGGDVDDYKRFTHNYVRAVRSLSNLVVSPANQAVTKDAGTTTFSVSNTGTGTMVWTAAVTSGESWLSITSGASDTNTGTINCSFTANTSRSARSATIRVMAAGAAGSPADVTVTQAGHIVQPILNIYPLNQIIINESGTTRFIVSNTGTGTMVWTAAVTSGSRWLSITSGNGGTDAGTITCSFAANTGTSARTATIRVTAAGAAGSPVDISVTQMTACTVTLGSIYLLQIPNLSYNNGVLSFLTDFVYEFNPTYPTLIPYKLTNATVINNQTFSCAVSTLSDDLKIHIPEVLLPDGITHVWLELEYSPILSTGGNFYWLVTNGGVVSN